MSGIILYMEFWVFVSNFLRAISGWDFLHPTCVKGAILWKTTLKFGPVLGKGSARDQISSTKLNKLQVHPEHLQKGVPLALKSVSFGGKLWANRSRVQLIVWCLSWNRDLVFKEPYIFNISTHFIFRMDLHGVAYFFWKMTLSFILTWFEILFPCTIFAPQTTWVDRSFHREIPLQPVQNVRPVIPNGLPIFASMACTPCCRSLWQKPVTLLDAWCCWV